MDNKVLSKMRREYQKGHLHQSDLCSNPLEQFDQWLSQAVESSLSDPTAMTLSTVSENGQPSQRIVLLKLLTDSGFVFFSQNNSRKAEDIRGNTKVSLHFPWHAMDRQVSIEGEICLLESNKTKEYFYQRPRGSQLAVWASDQSQPIESREALLGRFEQKSREFEGQDIPLPVNWEGYQVVPHRVEFWQGGEHRLHDRLVYEKNGQSSLWTITRLMP